MLLIENTEACVRTLGPLILIPGMNKVDPEVWDKLQPSYGGPILDLIDQGILAINKTLKPTVAVIKKTYSIKLLEDWLSDEKNVKGPVRAAAFEQLKIMKSEPGKSKKVMIGEEDGISAGDANLR